VVVFSTVTPAVGFAWGSTSQTCTGIGNTLQQPSSVYYVYDALTGIVMTAVPPDENGNPSQNVFYNIGQGCTTSGQNTVNITFLGSYLTDATPGTGNVIPFHRMGEQVIFNGSVNFVAKHHQLCDQPILDSGQCLGGYRRLSCAVGAPEARYAAA